MTHLGFGTTTAYKGYLIRKTLHSFAISKGGSHISFAPSIESAKEIIDQLT